jgi:2-oxoglutarate ferredoxin oxidoreductase subunit beta
MRRNVNMVYIIENNGVYGLTKGQFSATAEKGLQLKKQGSNPYMPIDLCMEAVISNATFVARSFAGNPKQVKELIKAAYSHEGIAILDIISPCVTFNNNEDSHYSYPWGKEHEAPLHDITYVPPRNEIMLDKELQAGEIREVAMHDGSIIVLKNLEKHYDPTNRFEALHVLEEAQRNNWLVTGLIYISTDKPTLAETYQLVDTPLNRLTESDLRPAPEMIDKVNALMF